MSKRKHPLAIIIGAGPAGLAAACELLRRTPFRPVVLEQEGQVGGLSRTVEYQGNRLDLGGHRFFSKSSAVMEWWTSLLPLQAQRACLPCQGTSPPSPSACQHLGGKS